MKQGATFATSLAGDQRLTSLNDGERELLCSDQQAFMGELKADVCRISAILGAAFSVLEGDATAAALQAACKTAYERCLATGPARSCDGSSPPPASCTASVADVDACLNDTAALVHELAGEVPDCDSLSTADVKNSPGATATTAMGEPESCQRLQISCPSISEDARAFSDEYCELIAPCCTEAVLGTSCQANVYTAAEDGSFDASAGAACLDMLRDRQADADYCDGLASEPWAPWQVIPECAAVFGTDVGPPQTLEDMLLTTAEVGHACVGTSLPSSLPGSGPLAVYFEAMPPAGSYLCAHDEGVYCDETTRVCSEGRAVGESCNGSEQCDGRTGYCPSLATAPGLMDPTTCAAFVAVGADCSGSFDACPPGSYCHSVTQQCTVPAGIGEACTPYSDQPLSECASGNCSNGKCASALEPLCGT